MEKKKIVLTGSTGVMGREVLKELIKIIERFHITLLIRTVNKTLDVAKEYINRKEIEIILGDITDYESVSRCMHGADYVIHLAAIIPPQADFNPKLACKVNYEGTINVIEAVKQQEKFKKIKLIYVGSVAEYGDRLPPIHWGRVGDPIMPSIYDYYAVTKAKSERAVIESGIKYWVSFRQTGILHKGILKGSKGGLSYHQPLNTHVEWVTARDSGRLMGKVIENEKDLPDDFWCQIYNIGGGEKYRLTSYEFLSKMYSTLDLDFKKIIEPKWYALKNFHCLYFLDSDKLESYFNFRSEGFDKFLEEIKKEMKFSYKLLRLIPSKIIKEKIIKPSTLCENGTLYWIQNNLEGPINAFWGSKEEWDKISPWDEFSLNVCEERIILDHGYNECKPKSELDIEDMKEAASFRGGDCLSETMIKGDLKTKLKWKCAFDHIFEASPTLVLLGGHWCSECAPSPWNYDEIAKKNPFIAQVWYSNHEKDENNFYDEIHS